MAMTADAKTPDASASPQASFFRQSGWLMIANVAGGVMMWAVHLLAKAIPPGQYGNFGAFLAVAMVLPTIPLQMVLAQQTARAAATGNERQLSGVLRWMLGGTFVIWAVGAALVLVFQTGILAEWKVNEAGGLYVMLPIVLLSLWNPLLMGVLQGRQDFFWLGWTMLASAVGRIAFAAFAVLVIHAYATGMVAGVLFGLACCFVLALWQTRGVWTLKSEPFDARALLAQIVPLTLGFLAFQILFTVDTLFAKAYFSQADADFYVSAGTMARALMWLVLPLAAVMFPRLVHSAAKAEKSNLMGLVLAGTAILALTGAAALSVLGPFIIRLAYNQSYVAVASAILPWYAFAMVPLAVANVLLNNLLARPVLRLGFPVTVFLLALGYIWALTVFHASMVQVLQTLGVCNLIFLGVCALFTWRQPPRAAC